MLDHEPGATDPSAAEPTEPGRADQREAAAPSESPTTDAREGRTRRRRSSQPVLDFAAAEQPGAAAPAEPAASPVQPEPARPPQTAVLFMPPAELPTDRPEPAAGGASATGDEPAAEPRKRRRSRRAGAEEESAPGRSEPAESSGSAPAKSKAKSKPKDADKDAAKETVKEPAAADEADDSADDDSAAGRSRRRGRRGRGRGKGTAESAEGEDATGEPAEAGGGAAAETGDDGDEPDGDDNGDGSVTRRRRRRRRKGAGGGDAETTSEDGVTTVVKVREPRATEDEVRGVSGSTRLEAKRQRRRGGREQRRTRPAVLTESEFLARREAVDRVMVIRQQGPERATQIGVLEDGILVEHYVSRSNTSSMVGSVYLGKVQNVLPSMEAAFVDVGRGRNAVLYAGEVNWDAAGLAGKSRSIEQALSSGDSVLVQVTKDPVGHKGARLTSNLALSGRHLVYTPHGNASGISRKLPENERRRLRDVLKNLVPDGAGVIVRTAAESASADELERDVKRLQAQWEDIQEKAGKSTAPALLYSEPDLVVRVVRDLFNEDFRELVIEGQEAYETVEAYLSHVSPDLVSRLRRHTGTTDAFNAYRIEEQILKGLDRKVFLPSGGHLVFDRTEAMTVIDVNTGKYTGTGGNLEETVTRNNLEAAEEIVRQLRLRDIGGIIVIDFIDMVLESNRELVLRRLTECLGRDRTKHQVTEITSLGLVQMTRKRVGAGLLEVFSEPCDCCKGRGVVVRTDPVAEKARPESAGAGEKVKAVASASTAPAGSASGSSSGSGTGSGRRRGRRGGSTKAATSEPAVADDDTMGYDLSRYEQPAGPVSEVAAAGPEPATAAPVEPRYGGGPEGAVAPAPSSQGATAMPLTVTEEAGLSGVLKRLRRRGGRAR
ncbi:ribonuclease E/G [Natronosporangium hydrolyticum]|uniref:Ribonuclease E n=1 Tax=Natronosporangium hydrolyticum TaxID=2811111 RepID=A0A895YL90_9ACTN|nr:Rne/Rng family ribonuclease [Natronosporangium hydrolyticum]QSB16073.1 ribonuclease E/G [Natronosporangium hydrolyticum]